MSFFGVGLEMEVLELEWGEKWDFLSAPREAPRRPLGSRRPPAPGSPRMRRSGPREWEAPGSRPDPERSRVAPWEGGGKP